MGKRQTYGWGIGHPDQSVATYLHEVVENKPRWVRSTLELAFYADQEAAADLLEELVMDDSIEFSVQLTPELTVPKERFLVKCLVSPDTDAYRPPVPRDWMGGEEFAVGFDWNRSTETRLRGLIEGLDLELPSDWTFQNLRF